MVQSRGIHDMHGGRHTRAYGVWCSMRSRCNNSNNPAYEDYGGRGIKVCDRWSRFSAFIADVGHPERGMTIERKDNDKGYSKDNCIWADRTTQGRNKRNNVLLTIDGETHPLSVWAERCGIKYKTVHMRIRKGWSPEDAVKTPLVKERSGIARGKRIHKSVMVLVTFAGEQMTLEQAAERAGLKFSTVYNRIHRAGWPVALALSEPAKRGPHHDVHFRHDPPEEAGQAA